MPVPAEVETGLQVQFVDLGVELHPEEGHDIFYCAEAQDIGSIIE